MSELIAALRLGVAPILAALCTLWAAAVALASEDEAGLPRLLGPSGGDTSPLSPARALHVVHLALLMIAAFLGGLALAWWAWPFPNSLLRLLLAVLSVWVVGDLIPRLWAANEPGLIRFDGRVASATLAAFKPLLVLVAWADRGGRAGTAPPSRSADQELRERLSGVFSLPDMTVEEVMTPRLDIISVDLSATRAQVLDTLRAAEHSRLLVVEGDPDNVVGVMYAKDLLASGRAAEASDWHQLVRPVEFVPEAKRLDRQLRDFQRGGGHLVVVVDEFGGTSGIVTLEDVLEQIVGEIQDEYDTEEAAPIEATGDGVWVVQGNTPLVDLETEMEHQFGRDDVGTVGGLVLALAGRVPRAGDELKAGDIAITIDTIVRRRVRRVTVRRLHPATETEGKAS